MTKYSCHNCINISDLRSPFTNDRDSLGIYECDKCGSSFKVDLEYYKENKNNEPLILKTMDTGNAYCNICNNKILHDEIKVKVGDGLFDPQGFVHKKCEAEYLDYPRSDRRSHHFNRLKEIKVFKDQTKAPIVVVPKKPRRKLRTVLAKATKNTFRESIISSVVAAKKVARGTSSVLREADKRVGKYDEIETEEDAYAWASNEIEDGTYKKGIWAKAFADSDGDEQKQKALYIKYRAEQLIELTNLLLDEAKLDNPE